MLDEGAINPKPSTCSIISNILNVFGLYLLSQSEDLQEPDQEFLKFPDGLAGGLYRTRIPKCLNPHILNSLTKPRVSIKSPAERHKICAGRSPRGSSNCPPHLRTIHSEGLGFRLGTAPPSVTVGKELYYGYI